MLSITRPRSIPGESASRWPYQVERHQTLLRAQVRAFWPVNKQPLIDWAPDSQTSLVFAGIFPHPAAAAVAYARCSLRRSIQATGKAKSLSVALDLGPPTIGIARKEQVPGLQSKFAQYTDPGRDRFASSLACSSDISGTAVYCISGSARSGLPTYAVPVTGSAGAVAAAWSDWVARYWLVWQAR